MPQTRANRFGVSFLSKKNQEEALHEELMAQKDIGITYIKSPSGYIISFDKEARFYSHVNYASNNALNTGVKGEMYAIEIPDKEVPCLLDVDANILPSDGVLITKTEKDRPSKILLSFDLDALTAYSNQDVYPSDYKPLISATLKRYTTDDELIDSFTVKDVTLDTMNTHIWEFDKKGNPCNIKLSDVSIKSTVPNGKYINMIYIFHGIIATIEKRWK